MVEAATATAMAMMSDPAIVVDNQLCELWQAQILNNTNSSEIKEKSKAPVGSPY